MSPTIPTEPEPDEPEKSQPERQQTSVWEVTYERIERVVLRVTAPLDQRDQLAYGSLLLGRYPSNVMVIDRTGGEWQRTSVEKVDL